MRSVSYLDTQQSQQGQGDHNVLDVEVEGIAESVDGNSQVAAPPESLVCRQYVVYSPTYQVPALYFSIHRSSASGFSALS